MINRRFIAMVAVILFSASALVWAPFGRWNNGITMTAVVGSAPGGGLTIQAAPAVPKALFGGDLVVPVTITSTAGPIDPNNLRVDIVYQLVDETNKQLTSPTLVPIQFVAAAGQSAKATKLTGTAIVTRNELLPTQNGGKLTYVFQAKQGAQAGAILNGDNAMAPAPNNITQLTVAQFQALSPFETIMTDEWCEDVGPAGRTVSAIGLGITGVTSVPLKPGAVSSLGTLCIRTSNASAFPSGPGGTKPAAMYDIVLNNTTLLTPVQLVLGYSADLTGKIQGTGDDPKALGIYWLDQSQPNSQWRALSRASIDTTLHTVSGTTGHFTVFSMFAAGAIGAPGLRPNERIITPNGDGINDRAVFGSGIDQVEIFDVRGHRVKTIAGPSPEWLGTDDSGAVVESGVYIYQYTSGGERTSGVIGVAK